MSLEGNLTAFGLSEILQLVAVQQKSGMLSVTSQDRTKVLFFQNGNIVSTRDRRRKTKDPLRDYLTRYGILSRENLIRLTHLSSESKLDLTEVIVSEGIMSEEDMRRHFRNHVQEEVHEILTWEQCSYKFIPGTDIIEGIKTWGEYNIEGMLMESMRRIDEFPQSLALLPDLDVRIDRHGSPKEDQELTTNEKTVRGLVNRERTLSYLISKAQMPQYEVYEAVRHLHEKGLVTVTADKTAQRADEGKTRAQKKRRTKARKNIFPFAVAVVLFVGALGWFARGAIPHYQGVIAAGGVQTASAIARNRVEASLRQRIEAYRARNGHYPEKLHELIQSGLATKTFMGNVDRHSFRYRLTENGRDYTLF